MARAQQFADHEPLDGCVHIGVFKHNEGVNTAEFHDGLLDVAAGLFSNRGASLVAPREGDTHDAIVVNDSPGVASRELQIRMHALGYTGILEQLVKRLGRLRHVRGVFGENNIARDQLRCSHSRRLIEREVPRLDAVDDAQRLVDKSPFAFRRVVFLGARIFSPLSA